MSNGKMVQVLSHSGGQFKLEKLKQLDLLYFDRFTLNPERVSDCHQLL